MDRWKIALCFVAGSLAQVAPAGAQSGPVASPERRALFEAMRAEPANLELMFAFAAAAVAEADYEAAIATLERMLIFNPDLPRVKLELGAAYFRLGAYDVARLHFEDVLASNPPDAVRETVAPFMAEIERRTATHQFSGYLSLGAVYSTNANLGPTDREVLVSLFPGGVGLLPENAVKDDGFGLRLGAGVTHRYDLGGPTEDVWLTTATYAGLRYADDQAGDFDLLDLVTGPRLTVDNRQFGTTVRPFVQGGYVRSANEPLYAQGGAGVEITTPLDEKTTLFGTALGLWRAFEDETDYDGLYALASFGIARSLPSDGTLRGAFFVETDRTKEEYTANVEGGLRLSLSYRLPFALVSDRLAGPMVATGFGQASYRLFDGPDLAVSPETRDDVDLRVGAQLFAPLHRNFGVSLDAGYFERFSNIRNYDLDNFEVGVSFIASF